MKSLEKNELLLMNRVFEDINYFSFKQGMDLYTWHIISIVQVL